MITRVIGCLAVIVVLFHDGIVLGLGQVSADQDAQVAAQAGAQSWVHDKSQQKAFDAAALAVASSGTDVDPATFKVDPSSGLVTVTVSRPTSTMLASHFHWFDNLTHPHSTSSATVQDQ